MSFLGLKIHNLRVVEFLGRGGMGDVYVGYDERLDRRVALKVIRREHRLKPEIRARLLREARVLSQLEHPHICRIYELVEWQDTDVMVLELIEGRSLTKVLADRPPGIEESFKLARQVAAALAAAHEQGVVHRDLKPDNVMVTPTGDVKVLDFGLARRESEPPIRPGGKLSEDLRLAESARETPLATKLGRFLGTPAYMSPEQALGQAVTSASDMYSFGVLLQEIFTRESAYPPGFSLASLVLAITEARTLPVRGVDPDLAALIERLKSKAPARRPSAVDFRDRLRWIEDKPRRRRRGALQAAAMTFLVLASAALALQSQRVGREAERANREAERANQEAVASQQVSAFLVDLLERSDPDKRASPEGRAEGASSVFAREIMDGAADRIAGELPGQPLIRARLMDTISVIYRKLGLFDQALPLGRQALEIRRENLGEGAEVADSQVHLAYLLWRLGRFDEAIPLYESSIEIRRRVLAPDHPDLAESLNGLAIVHWNQGRYDAAEPLYRQALDIRQKAFGSEYSAVAYSAVASSLDNLAILYKDQMRYEAAEPLYHRSLRIREKLLGPDHNLVATSLNNLGELYSDQGKLARAQPLYERAISIWEQSRGAEHPSVGVGLVNLAAIHNQLGNPESARALCERALGLFEKALGPDHPYVGYALAERGAVLMNQGRYAEAEEPLSRSLAIFERTLGPDHVDVGHRLEELAEVLKMRGETTRADALFERSRTILGQAPGVEQTETQKREGPSAA